MFTQNSELSLKLQAYEQGADDYITKPIDMQELKAKLKGISKRAQQLESQWKFKDLYFNSTQLEAFYMDSESESPSPLNLTPKEFLILLYLARNEGEIFTRKQIILEVWGNSTHVSNRTVDQHIAHLRKKVVKSVISLEPVRGKGYKLSS